MRERGRKTKRGMERGKRRVEKRDTNPHINARLKMKTGRIHMKK